MTPEDLPDHLHPAPKGDPGRLQCAACRRHVSVGPDGTEYGHQRASRGKDYPLPGRCPHRPDGVDPTPNSPDMGRTGADARDDTGRWQPLDA